ncbi:MAG: HD domain-containing protein [Anaerolineae bacterium]|nr:HD domain-containing protein [Anaerolineales bacterium]MCW5846986.1 HD domain-containing protein [Anaerolineae bacterium]
MILEVGPILDLLMHGNQLKRTNRTGWGQRGVPLAESVADHSYGVAYAALVLAELIDEPLDLAAVLAMAVLHDLPESLTTDIPPSVWCLLPDGAKASAERDALNRIVDHTPVEPRLVAWWEEMRQNSTAEARLVHDADKLDLYLQALVYEHHTGNRQLAEFWQKSPHFHFRQSQALYDELRRRRVA